MARHGEAKTVQPLDKPTRTKLDEIGKMGQGQRSFIAWLYLKEDDARRKVKPGTKADKELRSMGFRFHRYAYLGQHHSQQQSNEVSRWLKKFEERDLILRFSETGKHISHIRLTALGRTAGVFYHYFGGCSPKELDDAVEFSAHWQRKQLQATKRLLLFPHKGQGLHATIHLRTREAELTDEIKMLESKFLDHLMKLPPDGIAKIIKLAHDLQDAARRHEFTDGAPYPFHSSLEERDHLSIN